MLCWLQPPVGHRMCNACVCWALISCLVSAAVTGRALLAALYVAPSCVCVPQQLLLVVCCWCLPQLTANRL